MTPFRNLLVVLWLWTAAFPVWLAGGSRREAKTRADHSSSDGKQPRSTTRSKHQGEMAHTSSQPSLRESPLGALPEHLLAKVDRFHQWSPLFPMICLKFGDPRISHHQHLLNQLKQHPPSDAVTPVALAAFALPILVDVGATLAVALGATPAKPYFLPKDLFGGLDFWQQLMVPPWEHVREDDLAVPAALTLLRMPRDITSFLNPTANNVQDPTLYAWFATHDYVFPTAPFGHKDWGRARVASLINHGEKIRKCLYAEKDIITFVRFLPYAYYYGGPEGMPMAVQNLMDQPRFETAIRSMNGEEKRFLQQHVGILLAKFPEELAYKLISLGKLSINGAVILGAVESGRPEVLDKLCTRFQKQRKQWNVIWSMIDVDITNHLHFSQVSPDIKTRFHDIMESCKQIKSKV